MIRQTEQNRKCTGAISRSIQEAKFVPVSVQTTELLHPQESLGLLQIYKLSMAPLVARMTQDLKIIPSFQGFWFLPCAWS